MVDSTIKQLDAAGLRNFALTISAVVAVLFGVVLPWIFSLGWPYWPWIFALVFSLWGVIAPATLNPVYFGWMKLGLLINKVTSPIILGILFFGVLMPFGLIRRFAKDPLARELDSTASSYKVTSEQQSIDNLKNPY